ncbi:MAG: O-antigen ligase family protein [Sediminibacterium sp.]|jgi:O-antigen ligase|uniref:O-antigen ligase family protein n=1 Tax=Sediminibacterium sp. TaxID=1917865 RepID=UPI002AB91565|nr:O-antigen ligase family protein [Sediminibacterium sp.]MDZ4072692.1 O-antigen ligase family protein [Sediminibacterium sp.]
MQLPIRHSRFFITASLLFVAAIIASVIRHDNNLLLIPFGYLLLPYLFQFLIHYTEKLFWLLLALLPLSTEINITPSLGLDFPDEPIMMTLTGLALLRWWHQPNDFPQAVWRHPLFLLLMVHILWIGIASIYSEQPLLSIKFLLAKIWYIIPFVILPALWLNSIRNIEKLTLYLLIPMCAVVLITLLRHALSGFSFESINRHLFPFFRNHVNYGAMLVCLLSVAYAAYQHTKQNKRYKKWLQIMLTIGIIALIFSYSRGAWLALIGGLITVLIIRKKMIGSLIITALLTVLISTVWLSTDQRYFRFAPDHDRTIFHTDFSQHMSATIALKDVSNAERFYRWVAGARMFAERPVTGFGPSTFYSNYKPYTVKRFETWVSNNPEHSTVHNYFLLTALEQGLIGLLIFCSLYFLMLWRIQKIYHQLHSYFFRTVALTTGAILAMIGIINFMSDMIETDKIGSLFWLCLGMVIVLEGKLKEEKESLV